MVGGPGLGKTTLLAQAMAENRLAPRGEDVWIGLAPVDADGDTLARDVAAAVAGLTPPRRTRGTGPAAAGSVAATRAVEGPARPAPDPAAVSDAVWRRAPVPVCLVFDDLHLVPPGSAGATWLASLTAELPANGHLVLAGRTDPPVPLARLRSHGALVEISEDDLRFTVDELADFAASRGVDRDRLIDAGGWPAMVELVTSVGAGRAGDYLWEEVLDPLGPERRGVLAAVSDLEGADDELATAALGRPVSLADALAGVPLVARGAGSWLAPHPLWRAAAGLALGSGERASVRRRAAAHLAGRGRFDEAFTLVSEVGEWDVAGAVLRAACLSGERPTSATLDRWLGALPPDADATPAARLARGLRAAVASPRHAVDPLREAVQACRRAGDIDGELAALALLGRVAWWLQDASLLGEVGPRVAELEAEGHPLARALAALGRAVVADLGGDDAAVLAELESIEPDVLDPSWTAVAQWFRANLLTSLGEPDRALEILDSISGVADVAFQRTVDAQRFVAWWALGRVDDVVGALPGLLADVRSAGQTQNIMFGLVSASLVLASLGQVDPARRYLDEVGGIESRTGAPSVPLALARAALALAEGDEPTAARIVADELASSGLERGSDRRTWRHALSLSYVLLPDTRSHWDGMALRGHLAAARSLAAAVVGLRERGTSTHLRQLALPPTDMVRAQLHHRFAAELAVGLHAAKRPEGATLLDALGRPGRDATRALSRGRSRGAAAARALLAAVPAPPTEALELGVLGPLVLRRGGAEISGGDLRRERVRELLAFLVIHRKATRQAVIGALWPRLDERSGANNLRVTLTYLLRLLEPDRGAGEPAYTIRLEGQELRLVAGDALRIDVDAFDDHLLAASRADADGTPSVALDHLLAAVDLYRGDLHADVREAEWLALDRDAYRRRFVEAATRAAQLLVGRDDVDRAESVARAAIDVDPWAEHAHAVLVTAALARSDHAGARRALDRCQASLQELGVEPSEEIRRLARRVRGRG
jgi:DNA-binding SARP family transcriptional activator/tetratricopeptide (TPR) repeat protein